MELLDKSPRFKRTVDLLVYETRKQAVSEAEDVETGKGHTLPAIDPSLLPPSGPDPYRIAVLLIQAMF